MRNGKPLDSGEDTPLGLTGRIVAAKPGLGAWRRQTQYSAG